MAESGKQFAVDDNVLEKIADVELVLGMASVANSAWARAFRIDAQLHGGRVESYFLKDTMAANQLCAEANCLGSCRSVPDTHFYLTEFKNLLLYLPKPYLFCERLAELHKNGVSLNGKFGFHVTTYNGELLQENSFTDTREEFFANGLRHMLELNMERAGPSKQLEALVPQMFDKVIPRLLRPLESSIKPSLVHGDLWCGNAAVIADNGVPIVFDPCCFWAHNEYELGNWRPKRNLFTEEYFTAYHSHYPKAAPEEDYDDRNALYAIRFNLHAATLFPKIPDFRESVISEMGRLVAKFPDGYSAAINLG
ncbi:hypothetical protein MMC27_005918 [Xylographa pallens]|nr:hypothetical protein [Xylographa pallens]